MEKHLQKKNGDLRKGGKLAQRAVSLPRRMGKGKGNGKITVPTSIKEKETHWLKDLSPSPEGKEAIVSLASPGSTWHQGIWAMMIVSVLNGTSG
eukprot:402479-Pelagomonas_calceolata.AAC.2